MKFLHNFITFAVLFFVGEVGLQTATAQELPATGPQSNAIEMVPNNMYFDVKQDLDKPLAGVEFRILDSLQNAYSYFTNAQQPFVYYPGKNLLVTIKRGAQASSEAENTLDDLFILSSDDWGHKWSAPIQVYRAKESANRNKMARYPSVYAFEFEEDLGFVYTAPLTNNNGWTGFINGFYYFSSGNSSSKIKEDPSFAIGQTNYTWSGTDSKIVGGIIGDDPFSLAVGNIMPLGGLPLTKTSSIGQRFTTSFDEWIPTIPTAWAANKFAVPQPSGTNTDSLRTSLILSLKKDWTNNYLYFAAYARYQAANNKDKWLPGVSKSTDNGTTWSEFEIFPWKVISDYAKSLNINPEYVSIDRGAGDFVQISENQYSFFVTINEDTTKTGTVYAKALHKIVELYKEGSQFGIRPIADNSGYYLAYLPKEKARNQMGNELMATRTVDGSKLLVKWVDFIDAKDKDGKVIKYYSTDIFVAVRDIKKKEWSRSKDITESAMYDRITWIPDFIPNDLKNIPVLKLESVPNSNDTEIEARARQRRLETERQYVKIANFDADELLIVGVEEQTNNFEIGNIYPNPATDNTFLDMNLPSNGKMDIMLVDLFGRTVKNVFSGSVNGGFSALNIDLGNQAAGTYFLRINYNGSIITKTINIIK